MKKVRITVCDLQVAACPAAHSGLVKEPGTGTHIDSLNSCELYDLRVAIRNMRTSAGVCRRNAFPVFFASIASIGTDWTLSIRKCRHRTVTCLSHQNEGEKAV